MRKVYIFIKTYWKHTKSSIDIALFFLSIFTYINPIKNFIIPVWVPVILIISLFLYVSYKIWLYEYEKNNEKKELNDIQKEILKILNNSEYKTTFRDFSMNSDYIRIGDKEFLHYENLSRFSRDEVWANIQDLNHKDYVYLKVNSRNETYSLTKKAFDYFKEK